MPSHPGKFLLTFPSRPCPPLLFHPLFGACYVCAIRMLFPCDPRAMVDQIPPYNPHRPPTQTWWLMGFFTGLGSDVLGRGEGQTRHTGHVQVQSVRNIFDKVLAVACKSVLNSALNSVWLRVWVLFWTNVFHTFCDQQPTLPQTRYPVGLNPSTPCSTNNVIATPRF